MRKMSLALIGVLFMGIMIARSSDAFELGENVIDDSGFEAGVVGETPAAWWLKIVG